MPPEGMMINSASRTCIFSFRSVSLFSQSNQPPSSATVGFGWLSPHTRVFRYCLLPGITFFLLIILLEIPSSPFNFISCGKKNGWSNLYCIALSFLINCIGQIVKSSEERNSSKKTQCSTTALTSSQHPCSCQTTSQSRLLQH